MELATYPLLLAVVLSCVEISGLRQRMLSAAVCQSTPVFARQVGDKWEWLASVLESIFDPQ
jgi:hypothetical protein